jgi:hypothetical protein
MKRDVGKIETGLEQGLKVIKKQPAKNIKEIHRYALWARGFVVACF